MIYYSDIILLHYIVVVLNDSRLHEPDAQYSAAHWLFGQIEVSEICEHDAIILLENDVSYHPIKWFSKNIFDVTLFLIG